MAVTPFTQAQVTAGDIQFVHDGGEAAPAYSVTVSDGALTGGTASADDHVHESERRADDRDQRADDHRRADDRADGYGSVGN